MDKISVPHEIRIRTLDLNRVRQYLCGIESLVCDARESDDLRVTMSALGVLRLVPKTIAEFRVKV